MSTFKQVQPQEQTSVQAPALLPNWAKLKRRVRALGQTGVGRSRPLTHAAMFWSSSHVFRLTKRKQKRLLHRLSRPRPRVRVSADTLLLWFHWNSALTSDYFCRFFLKILPD